MAREALEEDSEYPTTRGLLSIKELMKSVDDYIKVPERPVHDPFLLSVDKILVARGRGTVVTGKIERGTININDELELLGREIRKTICLGIEINRFPCDWAEVGDSVGILLKGIKAKLVSRGNILAAPSSITIHNSFEASIYVLTKADGGRQHGFFSNYKPQFFFRTSNITGAIVLPDDVPIALPGDSVKIKVKLVADIPLTDQLRFVMREGRLTVGKGIITKLL